MKKFLPLLMLSAACLSSCGEKTFAGVYKFQMGREGKGQVRIGLSMDLTNEAYNVDDNSKKFNLGVDASGLGGQSGETDEMLDAVVEVVKSLFDNIPDAKEDEPLTLPGYYKVSNLSDPKYGNKVSIAFDLNNDIEEIIRSLLSIEPSELVSNFVVSYCDSSLFTFQIPVSIYDLQMQLTWYGTYIDFDPYIKANVHNVEDILTLFAEGKISSSSFKVYEFRNYLDGKLPGEQDTEKRYGTHPTIEVDDEGNIVKNYVYDMNLKYQGFFSNTLVYQRSSEGYLTKIGSIYEDIEEPGHTYFFPLDGFTLADGVNSYDVVMKKNVGFINPDFSEETDIVLNVVTPGYDNSYACNISFKDTSMGTLDFVDFYQEPFAFRDFHDIKVQLKKD